MRISIGTSRRSALAASSPPAGQALRTPVWSSVHVRSRIGLLPVVLACVLSVSAVLVAAGAALGGPPAGRLPALRITASNPVPACVTPARLMRFLSERNSSLDPRYRQIAAFYRRHGEANRVRWDYAFFQMLVETNYLTFRKGDGRPGDVKPAQNNFAGIGTTGGGVPGDSYPDVSTGVLAQIQHLMVYSGERLAAPVAPRTREKQDDILSQSLRLGRAVTFQDLAGRWATDRRYGRTLAVTAERFFSSHCKSGNDDTEAGREPVASRAVVALSGGGTVGAGTASTPARTEAAAPGAAVPPARGPSPAQSCKVFTASYGGSAAILIGAPVGPQVHYTAVQVPPGFEASLARNFIAEFAKGGEALGEFRSTRDALARAFELCPHRRDAAVR